MSKEDIRAIFEKHTMPDAGDPELTMFDTDEIIKELAEYTTKEIKERKI